MKRSLLIPLGFLAPALTLILVFMVLPLVVSFYLSLTNFNVAALLDYSLANFIGLANYQRLLRDELFWQAFWNTGYFVLIGVPSALVLSLLLAILLNQARLFGKNFFKVGYYLPSITTTVAIAVVWRWVLNPRYGILNWLLGILGIAGPNWFGDPEWAMPAIILLVVWKGLGYNMVIFLAGLQNIPGHLYEAAQLDGAGRLKQLIYITIPLLRPTSFFVSVMTMIGYLQLFAEPYMLTDGGPLNATLSIVLYMYRHGFKFFNLGYASALAYVLFAIIFFVTLLQMKFSDKEIQY